MNRWSSLNSPGRATSERAKLELHILSAILPALEDFLAEVYADAEPHEGSGVLLAAGRIRDPFTLGSVVRHWRKVVDKVVETIPARLGGEYIATVERRLLDSDLPGKVYSSAHAVLSEAAEHHWPLDHVRASLGLALSPTTGTTERVAEQSAEKAMKGVNWEAVARMHARTEATAAFGRDAVNRISAAHIAGKQWVATMDSRTRPEHARANGQIVPVGAEFIVGGEALAHPGDPAGSPAMIDGCRCVMIGATLDGSPVPAGPDLDVK